MYIYKNGKWIWSKNKENLLKEAGERYQNLSEEEKEESASIIANKVKIFLKKKKKKVEYMRNAHNI